MTYLCRRCESLCEVHTATPYGDDDPHKSHPLAWYELEVWGPDMPTYYFYVDKDKKRTTLKLDYAKRRLITDGIEEALCYCSSKCMLADRGVRWV